MTLPVVWLPEADAELKHARTSYDNIRPELGERFALAVEATVEAIAEHSMQFPVVYQDGGVRECGVLLTEYSSTFKSTALW